MTMPPGAKWSPCCFPAADDYNPDVQKSDIIRGYGDGDLQEDKTVTRAEAMIMLGRAFGGFPELKGDNLRMAIPKEEFTDIPQWAEAELAPVLNAGIIAGTGNGRFSPDDPVTTGQMETAISRVYALYGTVLQDSFYSTGKQRRAGHSRNPGGQHHRRLALRHHGSCKSAGG